MLRVEPRPCQLLLSGSVYCDATKLVPLPDCNFVLHYFAQESVDYVMKRVYICVLCGQLSCHEEKKTKRQQYRQYPTPKQ